MRQWPGFLTLAAPVAAFAVLVTGVHAQSAPTVGSGWKTLFDGKDLSQWRGYKSESVPEGWKVVDGTLWKNTQPADLVSKEEFGDFELSIEWKIRAGRQQRHLLSWHRGRTSTSTGPARSTSCSMTSKRTTTSRA